MPSKNNPNSLNSGMAGMSIDGSSARSKWATKMGNRESAAKDTRITVSAAQDDGFTTVSHTKPRTVDKSALRSTNGTRQSPPSAAARSRQGVYENSTKPRSHYKQSCLPVEERDPQLVDIEANKGLSYDKSSFRPGLIVRGAVHEQDYIATSTGTNLTITDRNRTNSAYGPLCSKHRKMIVLSLYQDHYIAIPLFTHNGNGLTYKSNPDEFVTVRDHRAQVRAPQQSGHEPLETEIMHRGIDLFDPKSTAHVTYTLSRRYELPVVMEGRLTASSLNKLVELFNYYAPRQLKDRDGKVIR
ncbi:MAG: hypothetical protein L6R39_006472 [Caloplaca ligustica]|nr:MAG: hypothetical protein L6R39_006472 [Caloplaca ligustica]